jgi:chromosome segregation ATPase
MRVFQNAFASESAAKQSIVKTLEQSVQSLSREKTELFEQLELRTAELESSQHLLEQVQVQSKELQFHLRDVNDKLSSLQEEIAELRERGNAQGPASGPSDMTTLLLETEGKYAARLGEARNRIRILEQERNQAEEEWSKGSGEHAKALDRLRKLLEDKEKDNASVVERHKEADGVISRLTASLEQSEESNRNHAARLAELETHLAQSREADISSRQDLHDAVERAEACQLQIEALRNQESHLKTQNKVRAETVHLCYGAHDILRA